MPGCLHRVLNRLADGDAEAARAVGIVLQQLLAVIGVTARAGMNGRAPRVHQQPTIRLLVVADLYHVHAAFHPEQLARHRQRRTPLPRPRLRGKPFRARDLVVIRLRHRRVRFVAPTGIVALVLEIDVGGCLQHFFQSHRAEQRRRPPQRVNLTDGFRNLDVALARHLLLNKVLGENRRHVRQPDGLFRARVQWRRQWFGNIGQDVVPMRRDVRLTQRKSCRNAHNIHLSTTNGCCSVQR